MANPTTNYGFVLPTPTDLVTDLPADFEVALQGVDTQMKTNADAATQKATLTTTGDVYYASAASTPARLGIGTTGQVLTVSGGLPAWATSASGAFTLLSTTALTGASTTISGISGSYTDLYIVAYGMQNATANGQIRIAPNASTTITDAAFTSNSTNDFNFNSYLYPYPVGGAELRTGTNHICVMTMSQYSSTAMYKNYTGTMSYVDGASAQRIARFGGSIKTTSAITSLVFSNTGGNWSAGTVLIYGVK
jgi:hypothetical protein